MGGPVATIRLVDDFHGRRFTEPKRLLGLFGFESIQDPSRILDRLTPSAAMMQFAMHLELVVPDPPDLLESILESLSHDHSLSKSAQL